MIGWEYPPHNSGGLGVACEGMTQALSQQNTELFFTLPYHYSGPVGHMQVLECSDPSWLIQPGTTSDEPPFMAYTPTFKPLPQIRTGVVSSHQLRSMPQSEFENKVEQYAQKVTDAGMHRAKQFDVIHAHDWMSFPAALKLSAKSGKPYIAHIHSTEYDRVPHGYGSAYITNTEYQGMLHAQRVVAVSYYTKRLLVEKYGIASQAITVVHNGITDLSQPTDPGRHHFASKRPVIVFMGRLTMQKGAEYFLKLAEAVVKAIPDALFVVAGNGDMYHELLFRSAYDKLSASVVFSGFLRDGQKAKLLDRADVFVMPSVSEPFGLVALEAAQRHTPVIISKNAGVSEVLKGSIALDFWDIQGMTKQIVSLLTDESRAAQVRAAQLNDLQRTTWSSAAQHLRQVYRSAFTATT